MQQQLTALRVLDEVRGQLGDDECHAAGVVRVERETPGETCSRPAGLPGPAGIRHLDAQLCRHFHRVIETRVPSPGLDSS
jgi:hypothetical protein